ncbi:uncharacterized protein LOC108089299 [Drosophila ficusphila]|uniref:uncharacterized protein LOC108089299 n=1 Tax=Drosophila ficusphila TaxID=30025 RepID=UPI0007E72DE5|nr:uncharacterized protein LOC108089299 [Drosophila ficusphila]
MRTYIYTLPFFGFFTTILTHMTFTNIKCGTRDSKFVDFEKCYIKAVNRSHKYIDIHANLYQLPVDNVTVKVEFMRKDHGYKPFFVNITVDACRFLKNQKNPIIKMVYNVYKNNTNANHTCPFDHDFIIDHLWTGNIESDFTRLIPMMQGDYGFFTEWSVYNIYRAFINVYVRVSDRQF